MFNTNLETCTRKYEDGNIIPYYANKTLIFWCLLFFSQYFPIWNHINWLSQKIIILNYNNNNIINNTKTSVDGRSSVPAFRCFKLTFRIIKRRHWLRYVKMFAIKIIKQIGLRFSPGNSVYLKMNRWWNVAK